MFSILLCGACGRMGHVTAALAPELGARTVAGVDRLAGGEGFAFPLYASLEECAESADVLMDFTRPDALPGILDYALLRGMPLVLAATGYTERDQALMRDAASRVPVFQSANMSVGITLLKRLCAQVASALPEADVEIVETHHSAKLDSPSGTALSLLSAMNHARGGEATPVYGRHASAQKRAQGEIGLHAVRGGTVAGIHEVGFYLQDEYIKLTHTAQSREIFARGALRAAAFVIGRAPGLYGMEDLLGFAPQA